MASDSFNVEERLESIPFIGGFNDDDCWRAILRLMTDENVAVCAEMGKYLVARNDGQASELLFMGIALSDDQQVFRTLWEIKDAHLSGHFDIKRFKSEILTNSNFLARCGLRDVLEWLRLDADDSVEFHI